MEDVLSQEVKSSMSNNDASKSLPEPIEDKLSELNLKPKEEIDFSKAAAESERSSDNVQNGQHEGDHYIEGNEDSGDQTGKEKRRGSLERYKPPSTGNYSREEREKHRRRGHFGETKKQDDEPPDNKEKVGRSHGRFRGKGKGKENRNSYNGSQENQNDGKSKEDDSQGYGARGSYKSQLSKDWADYSFEDDAKPLDGSTTANNKSNTRKDDRAWGGTPEKESLTWQDEDRNQSRNHERRSDRPNPRHERNHNQRNDYRNQYEQPTDLRQKLNEKRAANPEYEHGSSENNFQAQNGNYNNGHRDNNRNRQKTSRGVVQSNWANKSEFERYSNDNGRGFKGNRNDRENKFNERHGNQAQSAAGNLPRPKKNTENFNPCHDPPEARILFATPGMNHYDRPHYSRDVIVVRDLFIPPGVDPSTDLSIYNKLLEEIQQSGVNERLLWQSWHGDSHLIADDKRNWKKACPTFSWVVEKLADYFNMHVEATRLNWYRDSSEWKPFHHDAAALKPDKARTQNITVAVSFGAERDAAFEHAANRCVISMPQPNGTVYTFARDVNILWRHGIPQLPPSMQHNEGRISIICWGWCETFDV